MTGKAERVQGFRGSGVQGFIRFMRFIWFIWFIVQAFFCGRFDFLRNVPPGQVHDHEFALGRAVGQQVPAAVAQAHVGRLPGRKQVCLYVLDGSVIRTLAFFRDEAKAHEALGLIDGIARTRGFVE